MSNRATWKNAITGLLGSPWFYFIPGVLAGIGGMLAVVFQAPDWLVFVALTLAPMGVVAGAVGTVNNDMGLFAVLFGLNGLGYVIVAFLIILGLEARRRYKRDPSSEESGP